MAGPDLYPTRGPNAVPRVPPPPRLRSKSQFFANIVLLMHILGLFAGQSKTQLAVVDFYSKMVKGDKPQSTQDCRRVELVEFNAPPDTI